METIVDLHVHSRYSRATSPHCDLAGLYKWGKIKGINIIGTGDFTHPKWFSELHGQLQIEANGLYRLSKDITKDIDAALPLSVRSQPIYFVPTVEISTIYSKNGQVRKLHNLVVMPSLEAAAKLNARLERIGNLTADGRPILGLDAKELLRHCLEISSDALYIPAHIWTPWFALFGSKSGFDTLEECYEDLTPEIRAIETGLSSDPFMNWRLSQLDGIAITSNSDAHSPQKLGREATILDIAQPGYKEFTGAIKSNDKRLVGTIEFFPEEGKYHYDGHRECGIRFTPAETKAHKGICPKCGRPLTVGVDYRVDELADKPINTKNPPKKVEYIIPLPEVLGELVSSGPASKKVTGRYDELIEKLGSEFDILRKLPVSQIKATDPLLAQAVTRMRGGDVVREPGYDGVYGTIRVFKNLAELADARHQLSLL